MTAMAAQIHLDNNIQGVKHPNIERPIKTIQFADDSPFMIGCESDFRIIIEHLTQFERVSGMVINKDKTIVVLLGAWNQNTPQLITNSPYKKQSINVPFVVLGTIVGPRNADSLNWKSTLDKIRERVAKLSSPSLTLNGKILVANACITSITIYPATHTYIPYKELEALKPILDHFTTPTSKYLTYPFEPANDAAPVQHRFRVCFTRRYARPHGSTTQGGSKEGQRRSRPGSGVHLHLTRCPPRPTPQHHVGLTVPTQGHTGSQPKVGRFR